MRCHYFLDEWPEDTLLGVREEQPECGEDFCDCCGECLACCGDDPCYEAVSEDMRRGGEHYWVRYVTRAEWKRINGNE